MAEELHTLLARAGEKPPYVLVGHSFGSFDVLMYAHKYPAEVAGIVGTPGHRSVGGMRVSPYNAVTPEAVQALTSLMREFQRTNG